MWNLIFDYDGTLHNCIRIYAPAFRLAYRYLTDSGFVPEREWTGEEISRWLGFSAGDMWNAFAPGLPEEQKQFCSTMIGEEMLRLTECGEARLYPGVPEILEWLKGQGYRLIFLSNCKRRYMEAHKKQFGLDRYFDGFYCAEDHGWKAKTEIFKTIERSFQGEFLVIGDRFHDMEIARVHRLKSIGCSYGYGSREELLGASAIAATPEEMAELVRKKCPLPALPERLT